MDPSDKAVFALSLVCYGAALCLPGLAADGTNPYGFDGVVGFSCLAFGWSTALTSSWKFFLPWTANFLYFPALLLWCIGRRARPWGVLLALGGFMLAALVFRIDSMMVNEAGHRAAVRPGWGAWFWMASMLLIPLGAGWSGCRRLMGRKK